MAKMHVMKRTVIPNHNKDKTSPNGEVKTYYLSEEELAYYRSLPKKDYPRIVMPRRML
ncbi:hypothetical protein DFQ01_107112 [Paenibacillus cellulosilyticus]|uniref:Uncharacterized protein n=1 Tax=Paenibacillus cellulosilyticus TaxID=375489 RepID=A0A2V2YVH4_9BACL|nr:hypothetical protein [Paenibacillus cellulosilyticus]PWW03215.1 hypothetical protein DFQ01_107112 [Paenibacillus cellulosilyticus]QKS43704.1 hypothetical protein HUB94_04090 [Paenibacillus cellulosilyticus]